MAPDILATAKWGKRRIFTGNKQIKVQGVGTADSIHGLDYKKITKFPGLDIL